MMTPFSFPLIIMKGTNPPTLYNGKLNAFSKTCRHLLCLRWIFIKDQENVLHNPQKFIVQEPLLCLSDLAIYPHKSPNNRAKKQQKKMG